MELVYYNAGLLTGVYLMLAIFFLGTTQRQAPYRTAFGWAMLLGFFVVLTEGMLGIFAREYYSANTEVCLDMLVLPLYILEMQCIVHQDLDAMPWRKRIVPLSFLYVPILVVLGWSFFMDKEKLNVAVIVLYVVCMVLHLGYMFLHLNHFQRLLPKNKSIWQSANWAWFLFPLFFAHYLCYMFFYELVGQTFYLLPFVVTQIAHGVLIYRQIPVDTSRMYANEQRVALDEFKAVSSRLKTRLGPEEHVKAFELKHPGFEQKLRALTPNKLTKRDVYLCTLICEGMKSSEIAEQLAISSTSVDMARSRLRDKLNLEKGVNLGGELRKLLDDTH